MRLPAIFCVHVHTVDKLRYKCTALAAHDAGTKFAYTYMTNLVFQCLLVALQHRFRKFHRDVHAAQFAVFIHKRYS